MPILDPNVKEPFEVDGVPFVYCEYPGGKKIVWNNSLHPELEFWNGVGLSKEDAARRILLKWREWAADKQGYRGLPG